MMKTYYQEIPMPEEPLWQPSKENIQHTHLTRFSAYLLTQYNVTFNSYTALHQWSVENKALFWQAIADYSRIKFTKSPQQIYLAEKSIRQARWFAGSELNFAENLLKRHDEHTAILFANEQGHRRTISYAELYQQVACVANFLRHQGIQSGDRVIGMLPNTPEAIVAMLATASLGAIWSSCSPDFGISGLTERFQQIQPKILFAVDGHSYQRKKFQHLEKIQHLEKQLPSLQKIILVPYVNNSISLPSSTYIFYDDLFSTKIPDLSFYSLPFDHPLYILYTSGTTGIPKCLVHGAGGTLIQHLKELMLHSNLHENDKIFFYTTTSWMMWNWLVSSLAVGATVVLYEGAPHFPQTATLYDLIDELKITIFGVGAKFFEACEKYSLEPQKTHDLSSLHTILTTGSPLLAQSFDYVYTKIKTDVRLSSCSGGTDIISCFALGNPNLPVYRGELQSIGLGMDVQVFDEQGRAVMQQKGELVCASPFPSMPLYFWNDPQGEKYFQAYFAKYPGTWTHGDYAEITTHHGLIIYGRSDATLKPSGVRIGTAEIYRQVEQFHEILDCLAIGQAWENNERIILFVVLRNQQTLSEKLITAIKNTIRENLSPLHVPAKIIQVPDLPRTINGKIAELAVKNILHNQPVKNINALANPESLEYFKNLS